MNSTNPELSWKSVTKGRRSKKSIARSLNSAVKVGNSSSPKRVGDFSGSDTYKPSEVILGQETPGKSENVPLKKRRHLLQSPSPHPWVSSRTRSSSPLFEDNMQLQYPSCSSGDFSGIELLAAAASMDDYINDADKKDIPPDNCLIQKNVASSSVIESEQCSKNNKLVNSLSNNDDPVGNVDSKENISTPASKSLSASPDDGTVPKVDRKHWDLNTPMDAWGEQCDGLDTGNTLKDVNEGRYMEELDKNVGNHVLPNGTGTTDDLSSLKIEQDKSTSVAAADRICNELPKLEESLLEPPNFTYSHAGKDNTDQAPESGQDEKNSILALTYNADLKNLNQVSSLDATVCSSPCSKLCCGSGMLKSEVKSNAIYGTVAMKEDTDCSSNKSECVRNAAPGGSRTGTDEVDAHDMMAASKCANDIQPKDIKVLQKSSSPGAYTVDAQPVGSTDSSKEVDGSFLSSSTMADCKQFSELAKLDNKHGEDRNLPGEDSKRVILVDTCKSSSAVAQCDKPTTVGRIGLVLDNQRDSNVSQDNHVNMVNGDDLTGFQEGYDSPYEDGELRGSFLYSWEDNEMENDCVDYESDGRNGDGSDAADYLGSEIVEGGSEGSNGTGRSLSMKISAEGKSESGTVKHSLKKHVVKDDSDNNEIAGKGSNAGSGSTVDQSMEMPVEENDGMKRLELVDHKSTLNVRMAQIDEYASKAVKGKLQSRIEGRSTTDATDGKDGFFMQPRSRRIPGPYPRPERDISPDRYLGRYRSGPPGERDGVHQWTSWGSRRHYTTKYHGGEGRDNTRPRSKTSESANKIDGVDYHEPRQTNYLSKGSHRPFMRRSPVEREDYFGVGRRIPMTRGAGNYRGRGGHYSQRPGRDFAEDFEPLPEDSGAPARMPHYLSRREHSFSPSSGRQTHMTLPRRRSRSRSRTRSPPRGWQNSHRERILGTKRLSRSPDFRSEARMERMRMPFSKANFASDYGEGCISPSRSRFSPPRNSRWDDDRNYADNHIRRRRSPVRVFRRNQRFDGVGSSGRLKSDEHFRPVIRPGRFSFMGNGDRDCKLESNYDNRRRGGGGDDGDEMIHHDDDGGNMRRFRHNMAGEPF